MSKPTQEATNNVMMAETDDGAVPLYDQAALSVLARQRDALLAALDRLANAALSREITTGDPCNLIAVKGELDAARKHARAVILEVKGGA